MQLNKNIVIKYNKLLYEACRYYDLDTKELLYIDKIGIYCVSSSMLHCNHITTIQKFIEYSKIYYPYLAPFIGFYYSDYTSYSQKFYLLSINNIIREMRKSTNKWFSQ